MLIGQTERNTLRIHLLESPPMEYANKSFDSLMNAFCLLIMLKCEGVLSLSLLWSVANYPCIKEASQIFPIKY